MVIPDSAEKFDLNSRHYGEIKQAYESLWSFFTSINGLNIDGDQDMLDISHKSGERVKIESNGVFKIKRVGFEAGGSNDSVDICFKPDLNIIGVEYNGQQEPIIESSATSVAYIEIEEEQRGKDVANVLSAFHYDFEMDPDDRHPIFHSQYDPSSIQIGTLNSEYDIQNQSHITDGVPNHPRVPTAPLDFAGVLHMFVEEHIDEFDSAWPGGTLTAIERLPKIPAWCFQPDPLCNGAMLPEWWYLRSRGEDSLPDDIISARGIQ